jgi:hypothetical protein
MIGAGVCAKPKRPSAAPRCPEKRKGAPSGAWEAERNVPMPSVDGCRPIGDDTVGRRPDRHSHDVVAGRRAICARGSGPRERSGPVGDLSRDDRDESGYFCGGTRLPHDPVSLPGREDRGGCGYRLAGNLQALTTGAAASTNRGRRMASHLWSRWRNGCRSPEQRLPAVGKCGYRFVTKSFDKGRFWTCL